jgi:hypothetical protein
MKKVIYALLAVVLMAMFVSNTSETEFLYKIDSSKDPLSKYFSERWMKNAKAINESKNYFSPTFIMDYTNFGLFSIAEIEYGWQGTLRVDGHPLEEYVNKVTKEKFVLIFGREFLISETKNFE